MRGGDTLILLAIGVGGYLLYRAIQAQSGGGGYVVLPAAGAPGYSVVAANAVGPFVGPPDVFGATTAQSAAAINAAAINAGALQPISM
jgi:hypothetical protein